jgi:hypothetical protein
LRNPKGVGQREVCRRTGKREARLDSNV